MIPPPVNIHTNAPGAVNPQAFREQFGLTDDLLTIATVSRLTRWMKGESLIRTIEVVRSIGRSAPIRFVIVGEGDAQSEIQLLADKTNAELGRTAVLLTGPMVDPRAAYAAADVVVGMGASALRGMAFGKPVIIVGENGFCAPFNLETASDFYYRGIYGLGDGDAGNRRLARIMADLIGRQEDFAALGEFSRRFVVEHFAVETIADRLDRFMRATLESRAGFHLAAADGVRTAALLVGRSLLESSRAWISAAR
jgi:glycosyltransferase involved in cell wall biosynthesis